MKCWVMACHSERHSFIKVCVCLSRYAASSDLCKLQAMTSALSLTLDSLGQAGAAKLQAAVMFSIRKLGCLNIKLT